MLWHQANSVRSYCSYAVAWKLMMDYLQSSQKKPWKLLPAMFPQFIKDNKILETKRTNISVLDSVKASREESIITYHQLR